MIRERLAELLAGLEDVAIVGEAGDVRAAQHGIDATAPDVAIVDIRMPGGSGIDVLRRAKRAGAGRPCVIMIMYTNFALPQYWKACSVAGADYFFDKSTDTRQLAAAVRLLAERR